MSDGDRPGEVTLELAAEGPGTNRMEIDGVKVDVMSTEPLPNDSSALPDDDLQRLFVLDHRWALDTCETVRVSVVDASGAPTLDDTALPVATLSALIACKFHAIGGRRATRIEKRESDTLDLVRLIGNIVSTPELAEPFATAPFDLVELVSAQNDEWLVEGATRSARLISLGPGAGDPTMAPDEISAIGSLFSEMLNRR